MLLRETNSVTAIAGLGDDVVSLPLEERPDTLTNDFMVVGKEDSRTDQSLRGRWTTRVRRLWRHTHDPPDGIGGAPRGESYRARRRISIAKRLERLRTASSP
jgi:predicted phosphodiesterase